MRNRSRLVETSAWFALLWGVPLLISLLTCFIWCVAVGTELLEFPAKTLADLTGVMVTFLGVVVAVLVAALTTLYSLSGQNRNKGFITYLQALNEFRQVPDKIHRIRDQVGVELQEPLDRWRLITQEFVDMLNEITPDWKGYDSSPDLESRMQRYVEMSTAFLASMAIHVNDNNEDGLKVSQVRTYGDSSLRLMLIGLRNIDLGIVASRLVRTLLGLSLTLTLLLLSVLLVRVVAGLAESQLFHLTTWFTLFLYIFLPATAASHIVGLAIAITSWWTGAQRQRDWER